MIAITNSGGDFVVVGFNKVGKVLVSPKKPDSIPDVIQDDANAAIRRYATSKFYCEMHLIQNAVDGIEPPVIRVPGDQTEPVMSGRDCNGVIARNRCYIRRSGPRSEEPQSSEDWWALINRFVRASREDLLEFIRSLVLEWV